MTLYKSPLHKMTVTTPTCLWNDSASVEDLTYSIAHGAVGATCNPSIAVAVLKQELKAYADDLKLVSVFKPSTDTTKFAERICVDVFGV